MKLIWPLGPFTIAQIPWFELAFASQARMSPVVASTAAT